MTTVPPRKLFSINCALTPKTLEGERSEMLITIGNRKIYTKYA